MFEDRQSLLTSPWISFWGPGNSSSVGCVCWGGRTEGHTDFFLCSLFTQKTLGFDLCLCLAISFCTWTLCARPPQEKMACSWNWRQVSKKTTVSGDAALLSTQTLFLVPLPNSSCLRCSLLLLVFWHVAVWAAAAGEVLTLFLSVNCRFQPCRKSNPRSLLGGAQTQGLVAFVRRGHGPGRCPTGAPSHSCVNHSRVQI